MISETTTETSKQNEKLLLIALFNRGLTYLRLQKILEQYNNLNSCVLDRFSKTKSWDKLGVNDLNIDQLVEEAKVFIKKHDQNNIKILTFFDDDYKNYQAFFGHLLIFYRGDINLVNNQSIGFVGSREYTEYSKNICNYFISSIKDKNIVIVSGLAEGIDGLSHEFALENNLKTIAVLGSALDENSIYPKPNFSLSEKIIAKGGLLLSLLPVETVSKPFHFPVRNELIVSLSQKVLVVQAANNSGSIITGKIALKQNKCFVPFAPLFNSNYTGIFELASGGASVISSIDELINNQNPSNNNFHNNKTTIQKSNRQNSTPVIKKDYSSLSQIEQLIIQSIIEGSNSLDQIVEKTSLESAIINQNLSMMEIEDIIDFDQISGWKLK
jgi:DNA processing protein